MVLFILFFLVLSPFCLLDTAVAGHLAGSDEKPRIVQRSMTVDITCTEKQALNMSQILLQSGSKLRINGCVVNMKEGFDDDAPLTEAAKKVNHSK